MAVVAVNTRGYGALQALSFVDSASLCAFAHPTAYRLRAPPTPAHLRMCCAHLGQIFHRGSPTVAMTPTGSDALFASMAHGRISTKEKSNRSAMLQSVSLPCSQLGRLVERFFNKIKHCRRVATRYDKLGAN